MLPAYRKKSNFYSRHFLIYYIQNELLIENDKNILIRNLNSVINMKDRAMFFYVLQRKHFFQIQLKF